MASPGPPGFAISEVRFSSRMPYPPQGSPGRVPVCSHDVRGKSPVTWLGGRVVMQRTANPRTPVRFRPKPPVRRKPASAGFLLSAFRSSQDGRFLSAACCGRLCGRRPPGWRNGRRRGLKIPRPQGHVGSSPTPGTKPFSPLFPIRNAWRRVRHRPCVWVVPARFESLPGHHRGSAPALPCATRDDAFDLRRRLVRVCAVRVRPSAPQRFRPRCFPRIAWRHPVNVDGSVPGMPSRGV